MSSTESASSQAYLDETNTRSLIITCIVFLILDTSFLALRFLSRFYQKAGFAWEDVLMIAGWLTCSGLCIDGLIAPSLGIGTRYARVIAIMPEKIASVGWNSFYTIPTLYCFAVSFPKMSVLVLYLRIFVDRFSKACCWILLAVISLSAVVNVVTVGFQCGKHPTAAWVPNLPGGHCNNIQAHLTYSGLPNILTDVAMLILPIPVLRKLHVASHVKIGIMLTFLVASAGLVTAIIRFVQFFLNTYASDPTYNAAPLTMWVVIETSIYLISGCLLSCKQALSRFISNTYISSIYTWIWSTVSRSRIGASHNQYKSNSPGDLPPRQGNSTIVVAVEGNYYMLEPTVPGKVHVKSTFTTSVSDM